MRERVRENVEGKKKKEKEREMRWNQAVAENERATETKWRSAAGCYRGRDGGISRRAAGNEARTPCPAFYRGGFIFIYRRYDFTAYILRIPRGNPRYVRRRKKEVPHPRNHPSRERERDGERESRAERKPSKRGWKRRDRKGDGG